MGRRASRELVMKLLYQLEIQRTDRDDQIDYILSDNDLNKNCQDYIMDIVDGVTYNKLYIDRIIEDHSKGWKLSRLSKVDLSILRLSIYEIKFRNDIPYNVSINEAVELAKKYSGAEAGAFINGILGKFSKVKACSNENDV